METTKNTKKKTCRWFGWQLLGVIFLAFGAPLLIFFPNFFHNQLMKNLELTNGSRAYPEWKQPTIPLYMDIYMFNWTNPNDIKNKSIKPNFQQLGPYRFRFFPDKTNVVFDEANLTVNYRKLSSYFFEPEASNGSLSDNCTTVNLVAIGAGNYAKNFGYFKQKVISSTLSTFDQKIYVTKTIEELLFEGYEDGMIKMSSMFDNNTPFDRVGYFVKKNGTDVMSGNYSVDTGVADISNLGQITSYNGLNQFPFYEGECKKLKGSPGEFFPPHPSTAKPIYLFAPDMCRSIPYEYEKDIELHSLKGHRFAAGLRALDNGTTYEENACYATEESMPSGVMNVSICNYDHPMFISFPHFFASDASYVDAVEGLNAEKEKHQAYITLEPTMGVTLEVTARFQTNVLLRPYGEYISLFQGMPRIFMPQFWIEQKFILDDEKASQIKLALDIPWYGQVVGISLTLVGIVLMSMTHLRRLVCKISDTDSKTLPVKSEAAEKGTVIKDYEMNPLMSPTHKSYNVKT